MRQMSYIQERKRLEQRGISQVRDQFDSDKTRPNLILNIICFAVPLLLGNTLFFRASMDDRGVIILFSGVTLLMTMAIFTVLRPKRVVSHAFIYGLLSLVLLLMLFVGATPNDQLRHFFRLPV